MDPTNPPSQGARLGGLQLDDQEEGGLYASQWKEGGLV
jgi:hypothetical protein